jgi:gamma-butyrobetaine dioxygenase
MTFLEQGPSGVALSSSDGHVIRFGWLWLRDACPCSICRHAGSSQRLADVCRLPLPGADQKAWVSGERLEVSWAPDGHHSSYALSWLRRQCGCEGCRSRVLDHGDLDEGRVRWRPWVEGGHPVPAAVDMDALDDDRELERWLGELAERGLAMIRRAGTGPDVVAEVVDRFGYIRQTNYGRTFDVVALEATANLAYTGLGLGLHTDNPYRDPVPTLQVLHCRVAAPAGGDSAFADGFSAASELAGRDPGAFDLLSRVPVTWRYADDEVDLVHRAPVIELAADGQIVGVRYNERSRTPLRAAPELAERHLRSLRRFGELLARPDQQVRLHLEPGEVVVFDNRRVLHGRTPVGSAARRLLTGCYADRDGLLSRLAVLRRASSPAPPRGLRS